MVQKWCYPSDGVWVRLGDLVEREVKSRIRKDIDLYIALQQGDPRVSAVQARVIIVIKGDDLDRRTAGVRAARAGSTTCRLVNHLCHVDLSFFDADLHVLALVLVWRYRRS